MELLEQVEGSEEASHFSRKHMVSAFPLLDLYGSEMELGMLGGCANGQEGGRELLLRAQCVDPAPWRSVGWAHQCSVEHICNHRGG